MPETFIQICPVSPSSSISGYPGSANWPQKPRKAVNDVLLFV
ncbi:hypothetical protein [Pseudomonas brassicacearum]|nr:hypothetical protein [Pseudomonas brassicacearum]